MANDDLNRPYVGYRSAGRRPESQQDRRSAADAPLSALRGFASGVLGAPGDIESLIRMLPGLKREAKLSDLITGQTPSATFLPTSEDVLKRMPMPELSQTPTGRAFTGAGQLGGGFYAGPGSPLKVIAESPRIIGRAARDFAQSVSPVNVIKPKGGNWLAGSVERSVEPMRVRERTPGVNLHTEEDALRDQGINRWLETKLGKYIKNEMATPEDPLRAMAERGVLHTEIGPTGYSLKGPRAMAGFPEEGMGVSPLAKTWEDRADTFINQLNASDLTRGYPEAVEANPWLAKVPPETRVYEMLRGAEEDLGFTHLADELRNAINPASGLPENLLWKYQDLDKVTVPQAVERVAKINEWRAAQKAEADMARAMGPATQVVKEYPEQGFKWVELRQPKETVSLSDDTLRAHMTERDMTPDEIDFALADPQTRAQIEKMANEDYGPLADALKYEGETMGHCVGGYCPDVVEGRSKIYSLRDKKGQPHVTIEVRPGRKLTEKDLPDDVREMLPEQYADASREEFEAAVQQYLKQRAVPDEIVQIKGKGNKAPKEDYLPAVQDFVRSGQWGRVGDLENTGLVQLPDKRFITKEQFDEGIQRLTGEGEPGVNAEWFRRQIQRDPSWWDQASGAFEGFSRGGAVDGYAHGGAVETAASGVGDYNPAKIQSLVDSLREEMYG